MAKYVYGVEFSDDMKTLLSCPYEWDDEYVIPDGVTSIGEEAFRCSQITSIIIPDGVTSIGVWAFKDCSNLTSITIPDSVTSIGEEALLHCENLTSITIGNRVNKHWKIGILLL
ncbi:MAG: leucine-rich repeat domain-containing protein [Paludibacteraceae bacterium]|nr:leucine-rich repeat domain-containing protein [Paludibacteraceae bacterium]